MRLSDKGEDGFLAFFVTVPSAPLNISKEHNASSRPQTEQLRFLRPVRTAYQAGGS